MANDNLDYEFTGGRTNIWTPYGEEEEEDFD
uniref:Uncharacterized protein n=1 Tax=Oryza sativa subsp. japonica TaxID=39947 RepID=Q339F3_ORYSJ|nr:hypothetical protein LOC_Os10g21679 [Oryza sativa Japonica Group]